MKLRALLLAILVPLGPARAEDVWLLTTSQLRLVGTSAEGLWPTCGVERCLDQRADVWAQGGWSAAGLELEALLGWRWRQGQLPQPDLADGGAAAGELSVAALRAAYRRGGAALEVGRLSVWGADPVSFDGAHLSWRRAGASPALALGLAVWGGELWVPDRGLLPLGGGSLPSGGVVGGEVSLRPTWRTELALSDAFYAGVHHSAADLRQRLGTSGSVHARARGLDAGLRDVSLDLSQVKAADGALAVLALRHERAAPFSLGPFGAEEVELSYLLIGHQQPATSAELRAQRPLGPALVSAHGRAYAPSAQAVSTALDRATGEVGAGIELGARPVRARAHGEVAWQPGVGTFSGAEAIPGRDPTEDLLFVDLSGQGIGRALGAGARLEVWPADRLRVVADVDLRVLSRYQTAYVEVQGWEAFSVLGGLVWTPAAGITTSGAYRLERDLHALYGTTGDLHALELSLTVRR